MVQESGSNPIGELHSAVVHLERKLRDDLSLSADTLLFDLAVVDLGVQVFEASKATLLLHLSDVPRTAWAAVRQAFEATHDLLFLLECCEDRLSAGAEIYVGALHARTVSRGLLDRAAKILGIEDEDELAPQPTLRPFVREEAAQIEKFSPGSEAAILVALKRRLEGGHRHWSRLPRRQMTKRLRERPDDDGLSAMLDAYYDALSVNAHPRMRIGDAVSVEGTSVHVRVVPDDADPTPCVVALACVLTTETLLREYWEVPRDDDAL